MPIPVNTANPSFAQFIFRNKRNQLLLWIAIASTVVEWILFKQAYPFPDFFSDSYAYIQGAIEHLDINIWPIGYSKFLLAFHSLTYSDTALVSFQYFTLELSGLYFFFTLLYFYKPGKKTTLILYIFLFYNPLFLYISNNVIADPMFCTLTMLWITELLWIIQRPSLLRIIPQAILVFLAFTLRYNALYYPIITAVAFGLSRQRLWIKVTGTLLAIIFIIPFIVYSKNAGKALTGTAEYSILSGWQLANNALYIRSQITLDTTRFPNKECAELDSISRNFFRRAGPHFQGFLGFHVGNFFIQIWGAPLKIYMLSHYKEPTIQAWGEVAPVFATYGNYIIKTHPMAYARYFVWMNTKNYFIPPLEKLRFYNMGADTVWSEGQYWFHYKTRKIKHAPTYFQEQLLFIFPVLFLVINIFFPVCAGWFLVSKKYKQTTKAFNQALILATVFWLVNFGFSITANVIAFRYEFFPMILIFTFSLFLYEYMVGPNRLALLKASLNT